MKYYTNIRTTLVKALQLAGRNKVIELYDIFEELKQLNEIVWLRKTEDNQYDILFTGDQTPFLQLEILDAKVIEYENTKKQFLNGGN